MDINDDIEVTDEDSVIKCPECGSTNIEITGHCFVCHDCGYSLCSI